MFESLAQAAGLKIYPRSVTEAGGTTYFLARGPQGKVLGIQGDMTGFERNSQFAIRNSQFLFPLTPANAAALRARLPWLTPAPLGLRTSAGCGDRLGQATPGHIRALRKVGGIAPILAQQSMRENVRTLRTPQQVLDDAMWGVFQEGWREPWGADADHLKTPDDIDICAAAGYTFYTVDPGDHVDNAAHSDSPETLRAKFDALPWDELEDSTAALRARILGRTFDLRTFTLEFDEVSLLRAACKYGRAIAHAKRMYRHLAAVMEERLPSTALRRGLGQGSGQAFELEVSVDETETPTSPLEHFFIAGELQRLGVVWVSLAPRFIGRFEKGVDYIGDLAAFEAEVIRHVAVLRHFGGYKLSLHSGSDKFSIYPIVARHTGGLVHLKTAGTSYLEALRVTAQIEPALFREILDFARGRYETERATYHVSAELRQVPAAGTFSAAALPGLLDQFDTRQVLHVTYGSALECFGTRLKALLDEHEGAYAAVLETHFVKHLRPFR